MATTNLKYTTTAQLCGILGLAAQVPSWDVGESPDKEDVGVGNTSKTIFYLDQQNIINNSQTIYYGTNPLTAAALTETTHYTINLDKGQITLTSAGVTLVAANKIYAEYSYIGNGMSDSYITTVLERAEKEVDGKVNTTFTDGTATNPTYPSKIEIQPSLGYFNQQIIAKDKPLIDVESTANGAIDISQVTIDLASGDGANYPTTGYIVIGSEVMSYTGITTDQLTGVTRGVLGTTAATHSDGDAVHSTILFLANTVEGSAVDWTIQAWDSAMYAGEDGLIYSFSQSISSSTQFPDKLIGQDIANRIKIIYYYGYDTVPVDITRLSLLLAKRQLIQDNIGKALIAGRNEFKPEMFNVDRDEINSIVNDYMVLPMGNV